MRSNICVMTTPTILVVDDEPLARERLVALIEELAAGEVVGVAGNGVEAINVYEALTPAIVLLDIRMPGMDGLETARHLGNLVQPPAVVFTTAYDDHALEAFDANAIDYLLKPIRRERLASALARATLMSQAGARAIAAQPTSAARTHISALVAGRLRMVAVEEIRFFLAEQKYITVVWPGGEVPIEESLKSLEEEFATRFLRIHRNALIGIAHVSALERGTDGNHYARLNDVERPLPISRRLLAAVRKRLREHRS